MSEASGKPKWYHSKAAIAVAFFIFPPFALPFIWISPRYTRLQKTAATVVMLAVTYVLWVLTKDAFDRFMVQYRELQAMMKGM